MIIWNQAWPRRFYRAHKEKWLELPFGVDLDRFQPREKSLALANSLNLNLALPTILFVGGMNTAHYFKGVPIFLRALAIIQKAKLNVQALLVGDGELREGFELQARVLAWDSVRFGEGLMMIRFRLSITWPIFLSCLPYIRVKRLDWYSSRRLRVACR